MSEKATVKMSTKSWHYKLVKLVLGSAAPTPYNMHNLCPYFWLMIFSLLVSPIVLPIKAVIWAFMKIDKAVQNFVYGSMVVPAAQSWESKLSDLDVFQIFIHEMHIKKIYKKAFGDEDAFLDRDTFVFDWWEKKYNKKAFRNSDEHRSKYNSEGFSKDFEKWIAEYEEVMEEIYSKNSEEEIAKMEKKVQYEEKISKFRDTVDNFIGKIGKSISSWKNIIKWTKRTVGLLITFLGLVATYFVVNFLSKGVLWLVEHWNWQVVLGIGAGILVVGLIVLIVYLMRTWIAYMTNKGTSLWYVKIAYFLAMAIVWPLKVIFYHFIFQLLLVNIWFLLVKGAKLIWGSFLGFLGIFGEYFGASYSDYCPGIEWEEENE
jgi:hypothetical protein